MNVLIFAPLVLAAPGVTLTPRLAGWAAAFSALLLQNQLIHEQADASEDAAAGDRSTAAWLGPRRAKIAFVALGAAAAAAPWAALPQFASGALSCTSLVGTAVACSRASPELRRRWQRWVVLCGAAVAFAVESGLPDRGHG